MVDKLNAATPPLQKDIYWDEDDFYIPYTVATYNSSTDVLFHHEGLDTGSDILDKPDELVTSVICTHSHTYKHNLIYISIYISIRKLGSSVVMPLASGAKGTRFDSSVAQHVQKLFSRGFTYGAVDSLVLSWY